LSYLSLFNSNWAFADKRPLINVVFSPSSSTLAGEVFVADAGLIFARNQLNNPLGFVSA